MCAEERRGNGEFRQPAQQQAEVVAGGGEGSVDAIALASLDPCLPPLSS
jgi:hypothetical protein